MNSVIAGNWKMYKTRGEARAFLDDVQSELDDLPGAVELWIYPPSTALAEIAERCRSDGGRISVGAQNLHPGRDGAFTGELSARMLVDAGATSVLVGHSERRSLFGDTDELVARKTRAALESGLVPLVCVGETLEEREAGRTREVLRRQIEAGLQDLQPDDLRRLNLAYEPVWAIGTGKTATPEMAQESHSFLRSLLETQWGEAGRGRAILYGGSVKPANAAGLLSQPDIDGALIGGASLDASSFLEIARAGATR